MRYILSGIFLFFFHTWVGAQTKNLEHYQCAFFESYRSGDMTPWPGLIDEMERAKSTDLSWQTGILKAIYGLVGYQIGMGNKEMVKTYIQKADNYLDKLLSVHPNNAQLHSLAGAFMGYKISLAAYKAPFLGPKSLEHIEKAIRLDPAEPMGYVVKGYSLSYRPVIFGGDKLEAIKCYRKAITLYETQKQENCNWQKLLLQTFILKTLYETRQEKEAENQLKLMQKEYGNLSWIEQFKEASFMKK